MTSVSDNFPRKEVRSDHVRCSMFVAAVHQEPNISCGTNLILDSVLCWGEILA